MERVDPTTELGQILVWASGERPPITMPKADRRHSIRLSMAGSSELPGMPWSNHKVCIFLN